ncbi:CLIP domain-containing serine protease 2-like isoform X2 [Agrilus planipennis]|uniref:CLIP domain-containing serine protease n=1 Tax=Agrilus planipennis TaxID=224129 RepID=A0A7F5RCM3_AGRPL|nr:CLIP domain-containing serine protease 2-like isoform X2 [Agrilus planipennis]
MAASDCRRIMLRVFLRENFVILSVLQLSFLLVSTFAQDIVVDDDGCRTPDRGVGTCTPIKQCAPMVQFLFNIPKPISQKNADFIRTYYCGYDRDSVKVCCPKNPIVVTDRDQPVTDNRIDPPDVTNHRNINLVNSDLCGPMNQFDRILNGNKTSLFDFPWMALLSYQIGRIRDFRCGGTLINSKYVLTAAHCVTNLGTKQLIGVRLGEHNIDTAQDCEDYQGRVICSPPVQDFAVAEILSHPDYNTREYTNDIGLIRLRGEANLEPENVKPICLPTIKPISQMDLSQINVTVTGWGVTERGTRSPDLLQVFLPVIDQETCKNTYKNSAVPITHKQACAGGKNQRDSCGGDSGGPMQIPAAYQGDARYFQVGIVSFGPKVCGREGFPGVYTRVAHYMDWILDNLKP